MTILAVSEQLVCSTFAPCSTLMQHACTMGMQHVCTMGMHLHGEHMDNIISSLHILYHSEIIRTYIGIGNFLVVPIMWGLSHAHPSYSQYGCGKGISISDVCLLVLAQ